MKTLALRWARAVGRRRAESLGLAAALVAWWCVAVGSTLTKSATSDEPLHMVGGASYWRWNDYRLQPENGNLPQRWCAVPLVLGGWPLPPSGHPGWSTSDMGPLGVSYLFEIGNPARLMLALARSFAAAWGVLVALLVFRWSRGLFGREAAWLSVAFCLADTTLLANAPLATSDVCTAFFFCASTLAIWRMLEVPAPGSALCAGFAVAGLFLAKFSAPLVIPIGLVLLAVRSRSGPRWEVAWGGRRRSVSAAAGLAAVTGCVAAVCVIAWLGVWAAYGFRYEALNTPTAPAGSLYGFGTLAANTEALGGFKGRVLAFLGERRVLPEAYLYGAAYVLNTLLRQGFFCGDYGVTGWRGYFPFTLLVKTPLPTLAALALLIVLAWRRGRSPLQPRPPGEAGRRPGEGAFERRSAAKAPSPCPLPEGEGGKVTAAQAGPRPAWYPLTPLVTLAAVYWATSIVATLNIGHRHLLPVYPPLFVLLGALVPLCRAHPRLRRAPWALAACAGLTALWAFPHYLAFFNGIIRRDDAWHFLVDSNLDWGQEHDTLADFVARERRRFGAAHRVYGCLFDVTPQPAGEAAVTLLPTEFRKLPVPALEPGTYCVSATHLQGIYLPLWGPWTGRREEFFQDRSRAVALWRPLSADERQRDHGITPEFYEQIEREFHLLRYHRLLAQLRERTPDLVLHGSILVYRLDGPAFEPLLAAGPPAQAARFPAPPLFD